MKIIKSPGLLVLLSNEPTHEIKQRIIKYKRKEENKEEELNKIKTIIGKLITIYYFTEIEELDHRNELVDKFEDLDEAIESIMVNEIKINNIWKNIKNSHENEISDSIINIMNVNNNKKETEIDVSGIDNLIISLRGKISKCSKDIIKAIELGIEIENMNDVKEEFTKKLKNNDVYKKKPVGRPRKEVVTDVNQRKIEDFLIEVNDI